MLSRPILLIAAALMFSLAGGAVFTALGIPLSWILGAMVGSAIFTNIFSELSKTRNMRRVGQLLVGTATAGVLTPQMLQIIVDLLPAMISAAIAANLFGLLLAFPLAMLAATDRTTAILAALPAGMAEMASLAKEINARSEIVTVVHTLRVVLVVVCVPFLLGVPAVNTVTASVDPSNGGTYPALALCLALGVALALLSARIGVLNPFVIMPMLVGVALVSLGMPIARMPVPLLIAAQVLIGFSLGARLKKDELARFPRAVFAGTLCGLALIGFMVFAVAPLLHFWTGTDIAALTLGVSPGGLGEMIASAKALGVASAIVAGFQFVRSFLTNMIVPPLILRLTANSRKK